MEQVCLSRILVLETVECADRPMNDPVTYHRAYLHGIEVLHERVCAAGAIRS